MAGLAGLSPLAGFTVDQPQATPQQRSGDPADPRHARRYWETPERMPWRLQAWALAATPRQVTPGLPGELSRWSLPAGHGTVNTPLFDATPQHSHAAPFPKGVQMSQSPEDTAARLAQSRALHADGLGASKLKINVIPAQQDEWRQIWNTGQESGTLQARPPQQVAFTAGGYGSTDRVGNPDGVNGHELQNAHFHRRYAAGHIPMNYQWMLGRGRPMVKGIPGTARPAIGEASPFSGQNVRKAFGVQGAVLNRPAAAYEAPPDPRTAPPISRQQVRRPGPVRLW